MKKRNSKVLLIFTLILSASGILSAQSDCPQNTNITFSRQNDLDSFKIKYPNCKELYGVVLVTDGITNVDKFPTDIRITNKFEIKNCPNLKSFDADLISDGPKCIVKVFDNEKLESIKGLNRLKNCSSITIYNNPALNDSLYFQDLELTGDIDIYNNKSIEKIIGFDSLEMARDIEINNNAGLQKIVGFNNVKSINKFTIHHNDKLIGFDGFNNYGDTVHSLSFDCKELLYFSGFQKLKLANSIVFSNVNLKKINSFYNVESSQILLLRCEYLKDVDNFKRLKHARIINVSYCNSLTDLNGFDSVKIIKQQLYIYNNHGLKSINSFNQVDTIYGLCNLWENSCTEINGFKNVKFIEHLNITGNRKCTTINGFDHLDKVREFDFVSNVVLDKLNAFSNLVFCDSIDFRINRKIKDINEFGKLEKEYLKKVVLTHNDSLSICNVKPICEYMEDSLKFAIVSNNAPGCATREEIIESCKETSTQEENFESGIYPNPVHDLLNITGDFDYGYIYDISGRKVMDVYTRNVDCTALEAGIYFLKSHYRGIDKVQKFVKG